MVSKETRQLRKARTRNRTNARCLRHDGTEAEKRFWFQVRDRRLRGYKFKRQALIGKYIVDFTCLEHRLIVELDGGQHDARSVYDGKRDAALVSKGFRVIRFWNNDILTNFDGVLAAVILALEANSPSPQPSPPIGEREY